MNSSTNLADLLTASLAVPALPPARVTPRQVSAVITPEQVEQTTQVRARATRSAQIVRAFQRGCERARQVLDSQQEVHTRLANHHQQSHP